MAGRVAEKAGRLTDKAVRAMEPPATGNKITYDSEVAGFGVRITAAGARAFILNYRAAGRERRITVGGWPDWTVAAARDRAKELKRQVDSGEDPMAQRHADRAAPTVADLADRFEAEHLPKRGEATQRDYKSILRLYIRPQLGTTRVAELRHADIETLHRTIARTAPYRANRAVAVLSKMLSLAIQWEMRADHPGRGIERAPEQKRERFLSPEEIARLAAALTAHKERISADAIRLLLLTGARRGETLAATWSEFDLSSGIWSKPSHHTKTRKVHRVPLSRPALVLLTEMRANRPADCPFLFPTSLVPEKDQGGRYSYSPLTDVKHSWASVAKAADLQGVRLHDLRHSFASVLASAGLGLPVIGSLLGHTQPATTARYAHLFDDPLRAAADVVGAVVTGAVRTAQPKAPIGRHADVE